MGEVVEIPMCRLSPFALPEGSWPIQRFPLLASLKFKNIGPDLAAFRVKFKKAALFPSCGFRSAADWMPFTLPFDSNRSDCPLPAGMVTTETVEPLQFCVELPELPVI